MRGEGVTEEKKKKKVVKLFHTFMGRGEEGVGVGKENSSNSHMTKSNFIHFPT